MSGDHNQYQESAPYDMKECGTCGYPLLPEERTGLVEVNGKMFNPPDVVEPDMAIDCDVWSEVLEATKWVIPKGQTAEGLPKREWVSLTDEQIAEAVGSSIDEVYLADFRKVEAKLKELNNE